MTPTVDQQYLSDCRRYGRPAAMRRKRARELAKQERATWKDIDEAFKKCVRLKGISPRVSGYSVGG